MAFLVLMLQGLQLQQISSYIISDVFNDKYDTYTSNGDLNIGLITHMSSEVGCSGKHLPMSFLEVEALSYAIKVVNGRLDLLPNISLGMVGMDGCGDLYARGPMLARLVYFLEDNQGSGWTKDLQQTTWPPSLGSFPPMNYPVKGVTGLWTSEAAVNVAAFMGAFSVPVISIYATSDELSDPIRFPYFMRMVMPDQFSVKALVQIASLMNWTYVSVLYSEGAYGESGAKYLERLLADQDPKICLALSRRIASDSDEADIFEVIKLLAREKARVVFIWCEYDHLRAIERAAKELGLTNNFVFLGGDMLAQASNDAPYYIRVDHMKETIPGFEEHIEKLRPWENKENPWLAKVWSERTGCSWAPSGNNSCYDHPRMTLTPYDRYFTSVHARVYESVMVYAHAFHAMIVDGCPEQFHQPDRESLQICVQSYKLIDYLLNVSFSGLSHHIHFDSAGDIYGQYVIQSKDVEHPRNKLVIGKWDRFSEALTLNFSLLNFHALQGKDFFEPEFPDMYIPVSECSRPCPPRHQSVRQDLECCWKCYKCRSNEYLNNNGTVCEECPQFFWPSKEDDTVCEEISPTYLLPTDLTSLGLIALSTIGACLVVCLAGLFYRRRDHRLVKATSRELSSVIILGALFTFADAFLFVLKPNNATCAVRFLGFHLTISMLFSPLMVKTLRIYRIFYTGKRSVKMLKFVSPFSQLVFTFGIIILQIIVVITSNVISAVRPGRQQQVKTEPFVELRCEQALLAFLLPICFNVALILFCAILGYLTRKLPENFNESWYIFVSVSTTLFAWSVFLPTYFTVYYAYQQAALLSFCLLLNAFITVGCLFLPKAYAVLFVNELKIKCSTTVTKASRTGPSATASFACQGK